ncbi:MAG: phage holin family protein [Ruminococcus sp.]|nr:phage holin family protein [Ruminococcus sp.]
MIKINYIIMLLIVIGLALADFLTGWIKAYIADDVRSAKMRKGGLNKLAEIVVMGVAIGSEIGFTELGKYYGQEQLAALAGSITAFSVFGYIFIMEVVSILENYGAINPQAKWISRIIKKLGSFEKEDNDE